jgi:NAD(P)-dependent dehydrogenase (short-subunit alcohol dehydrogenase family)
MEKIALITGSAKGLGYETALKLGKKGYTVIVTARNSDKTNETLSRLSKEGIKAFGYVLDVNNIENISEVVKFIDQKFGRLDVLINNAGVQLDLPTFMPANTTETVSTDVLRKTFDTNFFAPIALTQQLLPLLKKAEEARIVNVSSIMGSLGLHSDVSSPINDIKLFAYDSSKTALNQFTIHLAASLKDTNIKVNSAHPGWVKTELGGDYAPLTVEEGAKTILDLVETTESGTFQHLGQKLPW